MTSILRIMFFFLKKKKMVTYTISKAAFVYICYLQHRYVQCTRVISYPQSGYHMIPAFSTSNQSADESHFISFSETTPGFFRLSSSPNCWYRVIPGRLKDIGTWANVSRELTIQYIKYSAYSILNRVLEACLML